MTMGTMRSNTKAGKEAANMIRMLLGDMVNRFSDDLDSPTTGIPRQKLMLSYLALDRIRERFTQDEKAKKVAEKKYAGMKDTEAKRRRMLGK